MDLHVKMVTCTLLLACGVLPIFYSEPLHPYHFKHLKPRVDRCCQYWDKSTCCKVQGPSRVSDRIPPGYMLLMNSSGLYAMAYFTRTSTSSTLYPMIQNKGASDSTEFTSMATDFHRQIVYAYDGTRKVIVKFHLKDDGETEVIYRVAGRLTGLTVDWSSGNLLVSDIEQQKLSVVRSDGLYTKNLAQGNSTRPGAVVIHQKRRLIIWTDHQDDTIKSSLLDGSDTRVLLHKAHSVSAMTIDEPKDVLYYFSRWTNQIRKLEFTKSTSGGYCTLKPCRYSVAQMVYLNDCLGIVEGTEERRLVVVDTMMGSLTKTNHINVQAISPNYDRTDNFPSRSLGKCSEGNGGCEQLCFELYEFGTSFKCACAEGYKTDTDNPRLCKRDPHENLYGLIVADQMQGKLHHIIYKDYMGKEEIKTIPVVGLKQPYAVAFDGRKVYWSDLELGMISRAYLNGSHQEVVMGGRQLYVTGLVVDMGTGSLYFTDYGYGKVGIINIHDPQFVKYIINDSFYRPFGVAIRFSKGLLHLTSHGMQPRLMTYNLDGSGGKGTMSEFSWTPRGITAYYDELYWIESDDGTVRSWTENGMVIEYNSPESDLYDVAVGSDYIFLSDGNSRSVLGLVMSGKSDKSVRKFGDGKFGRPTGLHVITSPALEITCSTTCQGVCVWLSNQGNTCLRNVSHNYLDLDNLGLCRVPEIENGRVMDNRQGAAVVEGSVVHVDCFPGHKKESSGPIVCKKGKWTNIPQCIRKYTVHGDLRTRGWVKFTKPGEHVFYKYDYMPFEIGVVVIGAGGGGYDVSEFKIVAQGHAGNGEASRFNDVIAEGGFGGTNISGGKGGFGGRSLGGNGSLITDCSRGGDAGEVFCKQFPEFSNYCGKGGQSSGCISSTNDSDSVVPTDQSNDQASCAKESSQNCSCPGVGPHGGTFGGGAAGNGGGGGGGGGYTCTPLSKFPDPAVRVVVGRGGDPSFGTAASGLVLVMWGIGDPCSQRHVAVTCNNV